VGVGLTKKSVKKNTRIEKPQWKRLRVPLGGNNLRAKKSNQEDMIAWATPYAGTIKLGKKSFIKRL